MAQLYTMWVIACLILPLPTVSLIHHLVLDRDARAVFSIETFGFLNGGKVEIRVHDVSVWPDTANHTMGFLLFPSLNDASTSAAVDMLLRNKMSMGNSWWCAGAAYVLVA